MQKPIHKKGVAETRDTLWETIRRLGTFTMADLSAIELDNTTVCSYLRGLVTAGYLTREVDGPKEGRPNRGSAVPYRYKLVKDTLDPPRVREDGTEVVMGKGRAQIWRAMKVLKSFTVTDLVACASMPDHAIATEEARTYVGYLARAGYLRKLGDRPVALASFRLVRWTGPRPPMIQRVKQVYDPNLKKVTWRPKGAEGEDGQE